MPRINDISLLESRGVGRRAPDGCNWLLRDIHIKIDGGCRVAIVGPTGSGKTLLMRALTQLDPIDEGNIFWRGEAIQGDAIPRFRQQVIYLQQRPTLIEGTVEDNCQLPFTLRVHRQKNSLYSQEVVLSLLDRVGRTEGFLEQSTRDLSGGEAQIVALVRAIQLQPTLLLLDEPTAALDDESTRMIEQLVLGWFEVSARDHAFVWVSHNKEQVARIADRVVVIENGQLSARGIYGSERRS